MEEMRNIRNEKLARTVIRGLESRNMKGYYAADKDEALHLALSLIPKGGTVAKGGSATVSEIGLLDAVRGGDYRFLDRETAEDKAAIERMTYESDVFLTGVNALTADGVLINIDGNANRVSAIAYGPKKVICLAGMNKVAPDTDSAMKRARNEAAPINVQRFGLQTPCAKTGMCMDCKSPDTICCQFLITRYSRQKDRIHVILINGEWGF